MPSRSEPRTEAAKAGDQLQWSRTWRGLYVSAKTRTTGGSAGLAPHMPLWYTEGPIRCGQQIDLIS